MKKKVGVFVSLLLSLALIAACDLDVTMINQDPYPAVPGDYVKLVFQVTGVENPECKSVSFELIEDYPISFDPGDSPLVEIKGGTYVRDYSSYLIIPYKVRIDENALDGENDIEVKYGLTGLDALHKLETFAIEVDDTRADFELHIDQYKCSSRLE